MTRLLGRVGYRRSRNLSASECRSSAARSWTERVEVWPELPGVGSTSATGTELPRTGAVGRVNDPMERDPVFTLTPRG